MPRGNKKALKPQKKGNLVIPAKKKKKRIKKLVESLDTGPDLKMCGKSNKEKSFKLFFLQIF